MSHHSMTMKPQSLIASLLQHATSGTDAEPNSTPFRNAHDEQRDVGR